MSTALDIITDAMLNLGALQAGEAPSAADAAYGLRQLNLMLDSWSTEALTVFCKRQDSFTLVAGTQVYPLGAGGTLDTLGAVIPRPEYLTAAWVRDPATGQDVPVELLDQGQWDAIPLKNTSGGYPTRVFYDPQYPQGRLNTWPNPQLAWTQFIESQRQLAQLAALTTTVELPPGYELALGMNLAMSLPGFGIMPGPSVGKIAADSKANIKRLNILISDRKIANDFPARAQRGMWRGYNILTNRPNSG